MDSSSTVASPQASITLGGANFYQKAAGMFLAAGTLTTMAEAQVVFWSGTGVRDTGNLAPSGSTVSLQLVGTVFASTAYGFVKGIGNLTFPGNGGLEGFFRGGAGAPSVGPANQVLFSSTSTKTQMGFFGSGGVRNNATVSNDNYIAFSFTSGAVNGGNPVYGWAQISIPASNSIDNAVITAWAYDSGGGTMKLGSLVATPVPEPSGIALLAAGAAGGVACFHRVRRRRQAAAESTAA